MNIELERFEVLRARIKEIQQELEEVIKELEDLAFDMTIKSK